MLNHLRFTLEQRTSLVVVTPNIDTGWLNNLGLLIRKGIVPTVLLLNPAGFGGIGNPDAIQDRLLRLGIKHYTFSDTLQDLSQYQSLDRELQSEEQRRKDTQALNRQSVDWRSLA